MKVWVAQILGQTIATRSLSSEYTAAPTSIRDGSWMIIARKIGSNPSSNGQLTKTALEAGSLAIRTAGARGQ